MESLSKCNCYTTYSNESLVDWTDSFLQNLKNSTDIIENAFDEIISVYDSFIIDSQKVAVDKIWEYLLNKKLLSSKVRAIYYEKLLFRGRIKGNFDETDIYEFFHLPFDKRHLVGNQRFSVSGKPMLYLGSSILAITKELKCEIDKLAIAGFLPNYSKYYNSVVFDLQNYINDVIENNLPAILDAKSQISYNSNEFAPSYKTISNDINKNVLFNLCTFPVEIYGNFVAEYVIPQLLTTALLMHNYVGIIFPSTKDYSDIQGAHRFSSHDLNIGIFVIYDDKSNHNETLLNSFDTFILDHTDKDVNIQEVQNMIEDILSTNANSEVNNNYYIIPTVKLKNYIEYVENSTISGEEYFNSKIGKLELKFCMKMLKLVEKKIR